VPGGGRPMDTGTDAVRPLMRTMPRPPPAERTQLDRAGDNDLVPRVLRVTAALGWRLLVVVGALYVIGIVVSYLAAVVVPVAVALLLAALLSPAVHRLQVRGVPRGVATALVMLGGLAALGGVLTFVVVTFVRGVPALDAQLSTSVSTIVNWLTTGPLQLSARQLSGVQTQILDTVGARNSARAFDLLHRRRQQPGMIHRWRCG
jgi:predicted PurR-regulated permease PerM